MGLDHKHLKSTGKLYNPKFMNDLIHGKGDFKEIGGIIDFLEEEGIEIEMMTLPKYKRYQNWSDYFNKEIILQDTRLDGMIHEQKFGKNSIYGLMYDVFNLINGPLKASNKKTKTKKTKAKAKAKAKKAKRCKECRCKPCLCDKEIHCYKITCSQKKDKKDKKKKKKKTKRKNKQTQKGGFCPPCFVAPVATALGFGGLGTAAVMVSKSSSTKSANGKTIHTRKESYKMKKNDKWIKKVYEQKNNKIYLNNKEIKPRQDSIQKANKRLNKRIRECIKSGFKQC